MKKIVTIGLFLFAIGTITAQVESPLKTDAKKMLLLTGAGAAFENAIDQIGTMVPEAKKLTYTAEAHGTLEPLYDKMADLYIEEFTHDEIKELIRFYETPLGAKLADKQVVLAQKAMVFGQSWGMELQQIAQKYAQ